MRDLRSATDPNRTSFNEAPPRSRPRVNGEGMTHPRCFVSIRVSLGETASPRPNAFMIIYPLPNHSGDQHGWLAVAAWLPQKSERACRPSLSNGFHCPGEPSLPGHPTTAGQYTTEAGATLHCPTGTVVWLNQETGVYHYRGSHWYGNTKHGAYMCESDSLSAGMRAAKNEHHP